MGSLIVCTRLWIHAEISPTHDCSQNSRIHRFITQNGGYTAPEAFSASPVFTESRNPMLTRKARQPTSAPNAAYSLSSSAIEKEMDTQ